jgi:hypothetical protein
MTGALLEHPVLLGAASAAGGECAVAGRSVTLVERLNAALHEARTNGSTECPVCQSRMTLAGGGGACGGCDSRLS